MADIQDLKDEYDEVKDNLEDKLDDFEEDVIDPIKDKIEDTMEGPLEFLKKHGVKVVLGFIGLVVVIVVIGMLL